MTPAFADYVALIQEFLARRSPVVDAIEQRLLNVRGKDTARRRDREHFEKLLHACFVQLSGLPAELARLPTQLAASHRAAGFVPVALDRFVSEFDPLEFVPRAYDYWEHTRWPGRAGRERYAHALYCSYVLRQLVTLSLHIWDDDEAQAGGRLEQIQELLATLTKSGAALEFVRDAGWLIPIAQGPLTRNLAPYFAVADRISRTFTDAARLDIHRANACLAGGHLRSQLRYLTWQTGAPAGDARNLVITRNSNALDGALLARDLAALLRAYVQQGHGNDPAVRLGLADAILQGLSPDPALFVLRLDLLAPYTTIEPLFVADGQEGEPAWTPSGETHVRALAEYGELVAAAASQLIEDASALNPAERPYSPHGIAYGFCADLLSNIAWDGLVANPSYGLTVEDMFSSQGDLEHKAARVRAWRALPTRAGERAHFDHDPDAAGECFTRLVRALERRARAGARLNASPTPSARLVVGLDPLDPRVADEPPSAPPESAAGHCFTSDPAQAPGLSFCPATQIVEDRNEGRFLASAEVDGHWLAVSKVILTLLTGEGRDAALPRLPSRLEALLRLTCPGLVVLTSETTAGRTDVPAPDHDAKQNR